MNFERKMIEKNCFISLKQKPVFDPSDDSFLHLCLLVFGCDCLVDILLCCWVLDWDWCSFIFHHWLTLICHLNLLDDFFVLKINLIHLGRHLKFILWTLFSYLHTIFNSCFFWFSKKLVLEDFLPWNSFSCLILKHFLKQNLQMIIFKFLWEFDNFFVNFMDKFF